MNKDIFIDNNVAKNFSNPLDPEYKKIINWLIRYDETNLQSNAILAVSNKVLAEYSRTSGYSNSNTNIVVIISKMTREGRLLKIQNNQIAEFKRVHFTRRIERRLRSNYEDRDHIPVVLLSCRKYALSLDKYFIHDLVNFPGFTVMAARRPEEIPYDQ